MKESIEYGRKRTMLKIDEESSWKEFCNSYNKNGVIDTHIFCTAFNNADFFWSKAIKLWLISLWKVHKAMPKALILYQGQRPEYADHFDDAVIQFYPSIWRLGVRNKGVGKMNFTHKIQSIAMADASYMIWADSDIVFCKPVLNFLTNTFFFPKKKKEISRVAGGLWCVAQKDKEQFLREYLSIIATSHVRKQCLSSDQHLLRDVANQCQYNKQYFNEIKTALLHFSHGKQKKGFVERYLSFLKSIGVDINEDKSDIETC